MIMNHQGFLIAFLFVCCFFVPEFAIPALLGACAGMIAKGSDEEVHIPEKSTEVFNPFTSELPQLNDEGQWVMNGKLYDFDKGPPEIKDAVQKLMAASTQPRRRPSYMSGRRRMEAIKTREDSSNNS